MKKAAFYTLGCKVNQYDTEAMIRIFEDSGYEIVDFDKKADVYVINTCTVTNLSDRKSRQMISRARTANPEAIIAVVGCYAQTASEEVAKIPGVNLIIGTKDRSKIVEYIKEIESGRRTNINTVDNIMKIHDFEELKIDSYKERTRAYIKIQEGCSQFCAYCIIPYARGPVRSREPEAVLNEVKKLAAAGFREVVITGIHVASYGKDKGNISLLDIIKKIHEVEGIDRIRLGSIEPTTVTEQFVDEISGMDKFCPHFHISLQSGCDETLKRMNRKYNTQDYRKSVELLRSRIPDVAITTDVMVGFPGETDEEFEITYRYLDEISFAKMHIFKYSRRKGTPAAVMKNQVDPKVKEERSKRLIELSDRKAYEFNKRFVGRIMPVLFEKELKDESKIYEGHTTNYIRVVCNGDNSFKGEILNIRMLEASKDHIKGEFAEY